MCVEHASFVYMFNLGNSYYLKIVFFWKLHLVEHVFFFLGWSFYGKRCLILGRHGAAWDCSLAAFFFVEMQRVSPETNSSHQKIDAGKTVVSFWGPAYFQGAFAVRFWGRYMLSFRCSFCWCLDFCPTIFLTYLRLLTKSSNIWTYVQPCYTKSYMDISLPNHLTYAFNEPDISRHIWGYLPNGSRVGRSLSLRCWRRLVSPMRMTRGNDICRGSDLGWRMMKTWQLGAGVQHLVTFLRETITNPEVYNHILGGILGYIKPLYMMGFQLPTSTGEFASDFWSINSLEALRWDFNSMLAWCLASFAQAICSTQELWVLEKTGSTPRGSLAKVVFFLHCFLMSVPWKTYRFTMLTNI